MELSADFLRHDKKIQLLRDKQFKRLHGVTYLDHAGAALYTDLHVAEVVSDLTSHVYGNPHSRSDSSQLSTEVIEQVRQRVLAHFNTSASEYSVIFTANCTAALHLIACSFRFVSDNKGVSDASLKSVEDGTQPRGVFAYLNDNHTSVLGMRTVFVERGANIRCVSTTDVTSFLAELESYKCHCLEEDKQAFEINKNYSTCRTSNIFAFPAQSNFSGRRYPLEWVDRVRSRPESRCHGGDWYVLLDAAALLSTSALNLNEIRPDFVTLSFYKMFGFPTGLGALLVRNESIHTLHKTYFGGGTVDVSLAGENYHVSRRDVSHRFEDGTLPFLEIVAVGHGLRMLQTSAGSMIEISEHTFQLAKLTYDQLSSWQYPDGRPLAILYHSKSDFKSAKTQGPIVTFNLLRADGSVIGFSQVERLASLYGIHMRTGCFCNMGACQHHLQLSSQQIKQNFEAGHVCGDAVDLIEGRPTGAIRISFGFSSTLADARTFLHFVAECFLDTGKHSMESVVVSGHEPAACGEWSASNPGEQQPAELTGIYFYPVKSCSAVTATSCAVGPRGLCGDREYMIVTESGTCLSQKRVPQMCRIQPSFDAQTRRLTLKYPGLESSASWKDSLDGTTSSTLCSSRVCHDKIQGIDCGDEIASWLQLALTSPGLRLVHQSIDDKRHVNEKKTTDQHSVTSEETKLSLANEAQYLLVATASVTALLSLIQRQAVGQQTSGVETAETLTGDDLIERFRPNLVAKTSKPFEEETWATVRVGSEIFKNQGPCSRCQMICIDQKTGDRTVEPLRSLTSWPQRKGKFGILLQRVASTGTDAVASLHVGDVIKPLTYVRRDNPGSDTDDS